MKMNYWPNKYKIKLLGEVALSSSQVALILAMILRVMLDKLTRHRKNN